MPKEISLKLTVNSVIDNLDDSGLPDGDPEINIFTTDGVLTMSEGGQRISFLESSDAGEISTALYVRGGKVTLKKRGAIESDMTFIEGEETNTLYSVGPYSFDMAIITKRIRNTLSEEGGELALLYAMDVGGQKKNVRMKITLSKGKR